MIPLLITAGVTDPDNRVLEISYSIGHLFIVNSDTANYCTLSEIDIEPFGPVGSSVTHRGRRVSNGNTTPVLTTGGASARTINKRQKDNNGKAVCHQHSKSPPEARPTTTVTDVPADNVATAAGRETVQGSTEHQEGRVTLRSVQEEVHPHNNVREWWGHHAVTIYDKKGKLKGSFILKLSIDNPGATARLGAFDGGNPFPRLTYEVVELRLDRWGRLDRVIRIQGKARILFGSEQSCLEFYWTSQKLMGKLETTHGQSETRTAWFQYLKKVRLEEPFDMFPFIMDLISRRDGSEQVRAWAEKAKTMYTDWTKAKKRSFRALALFVYPDKIEENLDDEVKEHLKEILQHWLAQIKYKNERQRTSSL